jgi:hypothetical protein
VRERPIVQVLFITRLLLYLVVVAVPFVHPAVLVPYDASAIGLWFVIIPLMMALAFYLSPPVLKLRVWIPICAGVLIILSLIFAGLTWDTLGLLGAGLLAFMLTLLVFKTEGKGRAAAALELLFSGALYIAFLGFSRSSEEIARASEGILKILFIAAVLSFILHAAVLFAASFPRTLTGRGKRNLIILVAVLVPAAAALSLLLPMDFIRHEVRINPLEEELERKINPLDGETDSPLNGNSRNRNKKLLGLSEEEWKNLNLRRKGSRGGQPRQYPVMVVATGAESLYLGETYNGRLDPVAGLQAAQDEPLNELSTLRLIETWRNPATNDDAKRIQARAVVFSALKERFFAYWPVSFTPTVKDPDMSPFQFDYEAVFGITASTEDDRLLLARPLSAKEKTELALFLEAPLSPESVKGFRGHLDRLLKPGMTSYEKVLAILKGFKEFQYELGFDERVDIEKMLGFVRETKTGDCTEFANATAILARLSGVPSRVVTGYLASRALQTPMHQQGIAFLREQYEALAQYSPAELLLVTTSHRHAWAQVYIAPFGWIDVEATSYAKPPPPEGDANENPLVLPKRGRTAGKPVEPEPFPWLLVLAVVGITAAGGLLSVYAAKYLRLLALVVVSRRRSRAGLWALQKLLLIKLIVRGYAYKPPARTVLEYAEAHPEMLAFAERYTELRYRTGLTEGEAAAAWRELRAAYAALDRESRLRSRKKGGIFREFVSLKGFRY